MTGFIRPFEPSKKITIYEDHKVNPNNMSIEQLNQIVKIVEGLNSKYNDVTIDWVPHLHITALPQHNEVLAYNDYNGRQITIKKDSHDNYILVIGAETYSIVKHYIPYFITASFMGVHLVLREDFDSEDFDSAIVEIGKHLFGLHG